MTLNILAVSAEAYPLAKTGGLGDAVSGMAQGIAMEGVAITLLLPAYPGAIGQLLGAREVAVLDDLPGGRATLVAGRSQALDLPVLLLRNDALYDREGLYVSADGVPFDDNHVRFAALSHAAVHVARGLDGVPRPHIVHAHDWHTALAPWLMRRTGLSDVKSVLTLHNIAFQGNFNADVVKEIGIGAVRAASLMLYGQVNFLAAGLRSADTITVVSHNYAREILTPAFGCGLEGLLQSRREDIVPIANGIDSQTWDPETDRYLNGHAFSLNRLDNKALCKTDLQHAFGLDERPDATVMAVGSRMTEQKMADVLIPAVPMMLETHPELQVCIMGKGDHAIEAGLCGMASAYPGRCAVWVGFDEARSHLLHAGADILLHGSRFEPFGLTPLYAMRYGTVPIGSSVGGMVDTIVDPGPGLPPGAMRRATGVLFSGETPFDMARAVSRAMSLRRIPEVWRMMQANGMRADFSWNKTTPAYLMAYQALRPDVALDRIPERRGGLLGRRRWGGSAAQQVAVPASQAQRGRGADSIAIRLRGNGDHSSTTPRGASTLF
ncbi:glycogen synthase GlgA [Pusillimonas sp. TS35]|uniref:glycogen synthase GlgA n=1 Tax=Paracandidimonas lactea TaxID=2895524 RepID=UPI00136F4B5B|nr:glycogen synthase GlgA [Pusillimonas sp. TS35]